MVVQQPQQMVMIPPHGAKAPVLVPNASGGWTVMLPLYDIPGPIASAGAEGGAWQTGGGMMMMLVPQQQPQYQPDAQLNIIGQPPAGEVGAASRA